MPANPLEKAGYRLELHDEFEGTDLEYRQVAPFLPAAWELEATIRRARVVREAQENVQTYVLQASYPKKFIIDYFRAYQPAGGYSRY